VCGKDWGVGEWFLDKDPPRPADTSRIVRDRLSRGGEFTLVGLRGEFSVDVVLCVDLMAYCCGHERDARVSGEHSLIMLVYNIKRSINILGVPELIAKLHKWNSPYKAKVLLWLKMDYLKSKSAFIFGQTKLAT
jgi:hypothetical protein